MRIKLCLFASLILGACASQSTAMQPQKVVDLYPMFERHVNDCSNTFNFDPREIKNVRENELAPGEIPWRECVYRGVEKFIIPDTALPSDYRQIVAEDRIMTNKIARGELTRTERRNRLEALIQSVKAKEENHLQEQRKKAQGIQYTAEQQQTLEKLELYRRSIPGRHRAMGFGFR